MMPPRCDLCGADFRGYPSSGKLLRFALSEEEKRWNKNMRVSGKVGHPRGAHWFCKDHYKAAQKLTHLRFSAALKQLRDSPTPFGWR